MLYLITGGAYTALKDSRFAINPTFMKFVMLRFFQTVLERYLFSFMFILEAVVCITVAYTERYL